MCGGTVGTNLSPSPEEAEGNLGDDFPHGRAKACCPAPVGAIVLPKAPSSLLEHFPEKSQIFDYDQALPHSSLPKGPLDSPQAPCSFQKLLLSLPHAEPKKRCRAGWCHGRDLRRGHPRASSTCRVPCFSPPCSEGRNFPEYPNLG